ncbi:MAG: hypothetical protein NC336_03825 [Clostridium sp.]|nr:hypothetical protein [Clostridium sp.]
MKKYLKSIFAAAILAAAAAGSPLQALADAPSADGKHAKRVLPQVVADSARIRSIMEERVIVGNDTVGIILPQKNYGRYDRGLFNFLFIPKGQWAFGLTASYGSFDSRDVELLNTIKDFNFNGKQYSLRPTVSYFVKNNSSIGIKMAYTRGEAVLGSLAVDFDDDINFSLHDVSYLSQMYNIGVFYRNYVGLGREKRFAVFNEVDLSFGSGTRRFMRYYNDQLRDTRTNVTQLSLNFSPGVCVFLMDYLSFNVSFGVFGINMTNEKQRTNGVEEGSRFSSGANFRFNLFNINFGVGVHI